MIDYHYGHLSHDSRQHAVSLLRTSPLRETGGKCSDGARGDHQQHERYRGREQERDWG
jgi:hypothetical protein